MAGGAVVDVIDELVGDAAADAAGLDELNTCSSRRWQRSARSKEGRRLAKAGEDPPPGAPLVAWGFARRRVLASDIPGASGPVGDVEADSPQASSSREERPVGAHSELFVSDALRQQHLVAGDLKSAAEPGPS